MTSRASQRSILGPLLFLVCINDMDVCLILSNHLLAEDCAIFRVISCIKNHADLQSDLKRLLLHAIMAAYTQPIQV